MHTRREFLQITAAGAVALAQPVVLTKIFESSILSTLSPLNIAFLKTVGQMYKIRDFSEIPGLASETEEEYWPELHDYYTRSFQRLKAYHEQMQIFKDHPREAKIFIERILPDCRYEGGLEQMGFQEDTIWLFQHDLGLPFMFSNVDDESRITYSDTPVEMVQKITKSISYYFEFQRHGLNIDDDDDRDGILFLNGIKKQVAQWLPTLIKQFFPQIWHEVVQGKHAEIRKTLQDFSVEIKDGPLRNTYYDQNCAHAWTQIHKGNDYY